MANMMKRVAIEWARPATIEEKQACGRTALDVIETTERIEADVAADGFHLPDGSVIGGMKAFRDRFPTATIRKIA